MLPDWTKFTLRQKIGQMIIVRASGCLFDHEIRYPAWEVSNDKLFSWLNTLNIGGVILLGGSAGEITLRTRQLQKLSNIPLFIAADIEEGVGQRFSGGTHFPTPMALGEIAKHDLKTATKLSYSMGEMIAEEALSIGINWMLAPIVDINNNPNNPVINIRSFGETPDVVSQLAKAFIKGAKNHPILTTAKHFPGHGNTSNDSHIELPVINHDSKRLNNLELVPFKEAISLKIDSIMSAHILINAWDRENPATLSKKILTKQLREKLNFKGLIITDALMMGGISKYFSPKEIAIRAIKAGANVLLMPDDPENSIKAIYDSVISGELEIETIDQSLDKIWKAKNKICNYKNNIDSVYTLSNKKTKKAVTNIIYNSIRTSSKLPLKTIVKIKKRNLIVVDDLLSMPFLIQQSPGITIPKSLGYDLQIVESTNFQSILDDNYLTLLQIFARGNPFRASAGLCDASKEVYLKLFSTSLLQGLIIYGSPYVLNWFTKMNIAQQLPWILSYGQIKESQEIACKKLFNLLDKKTTKVSKFSDNIFE